MSADLSLTSLLVKISFQPAESNIPAAYNVFGFVGFFSVSAILIQLQVRKVLVSPR